MKRVATCILIALVPAVGGCGTMICIKNDPPLPYSGTMADVAVLGAACQEGAARLSRDTEYRPMILSPSRCPVLPVLAFVDLPFSIAGDTVALPYTLGKTILHTVQEKRQEKCVSEEEANRKESSPVPPVNQ